MKVVGFDFYLCGGMCEIFISRDSFMALVQS